MNKTKKVIALIVIVLAFGLIAFGIFNLTMSNKSKMLNILYNYFTEDLAFVNEELESSKISTNTVINLDGNGKQQKYELSGDLFQDMSKNELYAKLIAKFDNFALNLDAYNTNGELYFKIKEIKDAFYKVTNSSNLDNKVYTEDDYKELFNVFRDVLKDSLKEKDFAKSKDKVTVDGSEINTTKYTMTIKNQTLYDIIEKFSNSVNDSKILKDVFSSVTNETDIKTFINSMKKDIAGNESKEVLKYSIFVKEKNNIVKHLFEVPIELGIGSSNINMEISILKAKNDKDLDVFNFNVSTAGMSMVDFSINETSKGKYTIDGKMVSLETTISGNIEVNGDNLDLNIGVINADGTKPVELIISSKEIVDEKEYAFDLTLNTTLGVNVISKNTITMDATIPTVDTTNAIDYDKMSDADKKVFDKMLESFKK